MKVLLAVLLAALPPAALAYDGAIAGGIEYLQASSADGRAMADYIRIDRIPITWGSLPGKVAGQYRTNKSLDGDGNVLRDDSEIVIDERLRGGPAAQIGEVIYHEYVHRAADQSGGDIKEDGGHSGEVFNRAITYIEDETGTSSGGSGSSKRLRKIGFSRGTVAGGRLAATGRGVGAAFDAFGGGFVVSRPQRVMRSVNGARRTVRGASAVTNVPRGNTVSSRRAARAGSAFWARR